MPSGAATTRVDQPSEREVVFSRSFEAPRELLWKAWSAPEHLHHWFGPTGFTTTTHEFAFVPGGVWRFVMHAPDGTDVPNVVTFREVEPPSRLVYENHWGLADVPLDFAVVVRFEREGTGTRLTLHMTFASAEDMRAATEVYGVMDGGVQTLERIASWLDAGERR
jgi:uncharacterized protein YndB with AHSA1/START domain